MDNKNKTYNYTMIGAIAGAIVGALLVVNKNKKKKNIWKIRIRNSRIKVQLVLFLFENITIKSLLFETLML